MSQLSVLIVESLDILIRIASFYLRNKSNARPETTFYRMTKARARST